MSIDYKLLGERIKQQRKIKGATQEKFAEHLNVSVGYVSQIERGISKVSLERLVDIARYLGCSTAFLLEGTEVEEKNYLKNEFDELFQSLSVSEKKMVMLLLTEYIKNRGNTN